LGLDAAAKGLVGWDVFDAVLSPGDVILLMSWRGQEAAEAFARSVALPSGARLRQVRVVRDYGMFARREAPQNYPAVPGRTTQHAWAYARSGPAGRSSSSSTQLPTTRQATAMPLASAKACPERLSRLTVNGPTIWPAPNAAVITPTASEAGAPPSRSASLMP